MDGVPTLTMGFDNYLEGVILSRDNRGLFVQWQDGDREHLLNNADAAIRHLPDGTRIGVYCKLGPGGRVVAISKEVEILPPSII